jgi:hypothetical protein
MDEVIPLSHSPSKVTEEQLRMLIKPINKEGLTRRVVSQITQYPEPRLIYYLTGQRSWDYGMLYQKEYPIRDLAMMSGCFASGGRITELVGGPKYESIDGTNAIVGYYNGLQRSNIEVTDTHIKITQMLVVKRSRKVIAKYGKGVSVRDDFAIPLQTGLYNNPYWDQLVPFGWRFLLYLNTYAPTRPDAKLFKYGRVRAWQIVKHVTGMFPNWFRAQAESFYGHYILTDSVKLAKFVKVVHPEIVGHYIGYSWDEQLKASQRLMDFSWIDEEVRNLKHLLLKQKEEAEASEIAHED